MTFRMTCYISIDFKLAMYSLINTFSVILCPENLLTLTRLVIHRNVPTTYQLNTLCFNNYCDISYYYLPFFVDKNVILFCVNLMESSEYVKLAWLMSNSRLIASCIYLDFFYRGIKITKLIIILYYPHLDLHSPTCTHNTYCLRILILIYIISIYSPTRLINSTFLLIVLLCFLRLLYNINLISLPCFRHLVIFYILNYTVYSSISLQTFKYKIR